MQVTPRSLKAPRSQNGLQEKLEFKRPMTSGPHLIQTILKVKGAVLTSMLGGQV